MNHPTTLGIDFGGISIKFGIVQAALALESEFVTPPSAASESKQEKPR
jgi:hypothetical protein